MKVAVLQQRQDWEPSQIKDLKLIIPEDYIFMPSNNIFITLGIQDNYLEKTMLIWSRLPPGSYITSSNIIVTALKTDQQCQKQLGWKSLLVCMHVSKFKAIFIQSIQAF